MRRLHALLMTAGLLAAPTSAVAGPDDATPDNPWGDTFEWSMTTSPARLGVLVVELTPELRTHFGAPENKGILIGRVEPKSAAAAAGLAVGDVLTEVKGKPVDSAADVLATLAGAKKNETVSLFVIRDKKPISLSAKMLDDPRPTMMTEPRMPSWFRDWFRWMPDHWRPMPEPTAPKPDATRSST